MHTVTILTKAGGVALGWLDAHGRLVKRSGVWLPTMDPETLDKLLRADVTEILEDGGRRYYAEVGTLSVTWSWAMAAELRG